MHNEFAAIVERDGEWFILIALRCPGRTARAARGKSVLPIFGKRFRMILERPL